MKNLAQVKYSLLKLFVSANIAALVKSLVSLGLLALVLCFSVSAKAAEHVNELGCLKNEYVADVLKDFNVEFSGSVEAMQIDVCNQKSFSYRLALALIYLKHGQYNVGRPSEDQSFENLFATITPYDFVKKYVQTVKVNDCKRVRHAWAYAVPGKSEINICAKKIIEWDKASYKVLSAIRIASLIVHEVRHIDPSKANHESTKVCSNCDLNVEQKGSYFFEKEFLYNIHKNGKNFSAAERNEARSWAEFVLDKNFIERANLVRPSRK
ncbi:MAG: hypothetical protein V4654_14665 [Bdellovibrionota bacterium]